MADTGNERVKVRRQLVDRIRTVAAGNDVDFTVVVKQHRHVVPRGKLVALPGTGNRLRTEHLQAGTVDVREHVEHAVVVTDARRPDAPPIDAPALQSVRRPKVKLVCTVAGEFPVHQVFGVHQNYGGVHVHRRAGEIIILAHTDHIGVFELLIEQWVGIGPVAVIGGPVSCRAAALPEAPGGAARAALPLSRSRPAQPKNQRQRGIEMLPVLACA